MARKCFISFKTEDLAYKLAIQADPRIDMVDKSLDEAIDSTNEDYIMQKIRSDYLADSTVTIHLIGAKSAGILGDCEQRFIKRELQGSLYDGEYNRRSGILGIVLPSMYDEIYKGGGVCNICGIHHSWISINEGTTISEFHQNFYIPHNKCAHTEDDRFCVLVKWDDFWEKPNDYIEKAFMKRDHPISNKVKVRP